MAFRYGGYSTAVGFDQIVAAGLRFKDPAHARGFLGLSSTVKHRGLIPTIARTFQSN